MTTKQRVRRCGSLFIGLLGQERKCNKPASYYFDYGKRGGYPVCEECAPNYHPRRLRKIPKVEA